MKDAEIASEVAIQKKRKKTEGTPKRARKALGTSPLGEGTIQAVMTENRAD